MRDSRTISMEGSEQLSWDDIDEYANKHGFNTTSGYIQYITEKEILGIRTKVKDMLNYALLLMIIAVVVMMLILLLR